GPLQLLDGPGDVVHGDHADPDEPLGVMGCEVRLPVIVDLRTGLHYFGVRVAHDAQQAGGIHHLSLDVSLFLELDSHCWIIAAGLQPPGLSMCCGSLGLRIPLADGGHRPAQVARVEEGALLPLVFVKDPGCPITECLPESVPPEVEGLHDMGVRRNDPLEVPCRYHGASFPDGCATRKGGTPSLMPCWHTPATL